MVRKKAPPPPPISLIKAAALKYAERGLRVIPLHSVDDSGCSCRKIGCTSQGKHNRFDLSPHGANDPYYSPGIIEQWSEPYNIGIALGDYTATLGYYLYAMDVDNKPAVAALIARGKLTQETACSSTGRGIHIWLRSHTEVRGFNPTREDTGDKLGEFRAAGQLVVAPPSDHFTGCQYAWMGERRAPRMVEDPIEFCRGHLAAVGIRMSVQKSLPVPENVTTGFPAQSLPDLLQRSGARGMRDVRDVLAGRYNGAWDRGATKGASGSDKLWWLAKTVIAAVRSHRVELSVEDLAGIVKLADAQCWRCYVDRNDADRQYFTVAFKAMNS